MIEERNQIQGYHGALTVASVNLEREMRRTKRFQKLPCVKDLTGGEDPCRLAPHTDDALSGFHDKRRGKRVDISSFRYCATLLAPRPRHYLNQESLRRASGFVGRRRRR